MSLPAPTETDSEIHWLPRAVVSFLTLTAGVVAPGPDEKGVPAKSKGDVLSANFLLSVIAVDSIAWGVGKSVQYEVIKLVEELGSASPICYVVCALIISATEVVVEFFISALCPWFFAKWAEWRDVNANSSNHLIIFATHAYCASVIVALIAYPILGAFLYLGDKRNEFWVIMVFGGVRLVQYAILNQLGDASVALAQTHWAATFQDCYLKLPGPIFRCNGLKRPATTTSISLYLTIQRVFMLGIMGSGYIMLKGNTILRWMMLLGLTILSFLCSWSLAYWADDLASGLVDEQLIDLREEAFSSDEEAEPRTSQLCVPKTLGSSKTDSSNKLPGDTGIVVKDPPAPDRLALPSEILLREEKTYDSDEFVSPRSKLPSLNENTPEPIMDRPQVSSPAPEAKHSNWPRGAEWGFIALLSIVEGVPGQAIDSLGAVIVVEVPGMIASGAALVAVCLTLGFLAWRTKQLDPKMKPVGVLEFEETKTDTGEAILSKKSANSVGTWMKYLGSFSLCIAVAGAGLVLTSRSSGSTRTLWLFFVIVSMLPTGALDKGLDARLQEFLLGFEECRSSILVYWSSVFQVTLAAPLLAVNWWLTTHAECGEDEEGTEAQAAAYVLAFSVGALLLTTLWFSFCDRSVRNLVKDTNTRVKKKEEVELQLHPTSSRLSFQITQRPTRFPLRRAGLSNHLSQTSTKRSRKMAASRESSASALVPPDGRYGGGQTSTFSGGGGSSSAILPSGASKDLPTTPRKEGFHLPAPMNRGIGVRAGNSDSSKDIEDSSVFVTVISPDGSTEEKGSTQKIVRKAKSKKM